MVPEFGYAIVYVSSVVETLAFYEKAFGLTARFIHESKSYAELNTGTTRLAFTAHKLAAEALPFSYRAASPDDRPLGVEFTFTIDDVDALYARALEAGAKSLAVPTEMPWGQRVAYVADLNGFALGIASPMPLP